MLCTSDKRYHDQSPVLYLTHILVSLMDHFARTLQLWKTWDHVTRLQNHHMIKGYLQGLYPRLKVLILQLVSISRR